MVGSIPPDLAREKLETVVQKVAAPGTGKGWHGESGRAAWRKLKSNRDISWVHTRDLETSLAKLHGSQVHLGPDWVAAYELTKLPGCKNPVIGCLGRVGGLAGQMQKPPSCQARRKRRN